MSSRVSDAGHCSCSHEQPSTVSPDGPWRRSSNNLRRLLFLLLFLLLLLLLLLLTTMFVHCPLFLRPSSASWW